MSKILDKLAKLWCDWLNVSLAAGTVFKNKQTCRQTVGLDSGGSEQTDV